MRVICGWLVLRSDAVPLIASDTIHLGKAAKAGISPR